MSSAFHEGERALQEQAGVRERAEQLGQYMLRDFMSEEARAFFPLLPYLFVGSLDAQGRPWASLLYGEPGFVEAPSEQRLEVNAQPAREDPLHAALLRGAPLGVLGIQLHTRRRNRINGHVLASAEDGFAVHVDQSFGNCPKYINARLSVAWHARSAEAPNAEGALLSERALRCIASCDTAFIASASSAQPVAGDTREGVDVSHRGGKPGFVRVDREGEYHVLTMPDVMGNNMFNTLGNLARYPRAGLLFLDFERGDLLQLTCKTELVFEGPELARFRGAQRLTRLVPEAGWFREGALPFRWSAAQGSPQNDKTGPWLPAT